MQVDTYNIIHIIIYGIILLKYKHSFSGQNYNDLFLLPVYRCHWEYNVGDFKKNCLVTDFTLFQ